MADWKGGRPRREPNPASKPTPKQKQAAQPVRTGRVWRGRGGSSGTQSDWGLWLKRLITTGLVLTVLGTIVAILLRNQGITTVALLSTRSYPDDKINALPARPGGGLHGLNSSRTYINFLGNEKIEEASLTNQLGNIAKSRISLGGPDGNVVLISIMAQGLVNRDGQPCLLDRNSLPFDDSKWTPLADVVGQIDEKIGNRVKKSNSHVVIILDSGSGETDWSIGVLKDDFRDRLTELVERSDKPFLPERWHLLHVRGLSDLSTFVKTGRRTLFSEILDLGLRGGADRNNDRIVALTEFKNYVESVSGVAADLYPRTPSKSSKKVDANPKLCYAEINRPKTDPKNYSVSPDYETLRSELEGLWSEHVAFDSERPWRYLPWEWARFEHQLVRAERAVIAGDESMARKCLDAARVQHEDLRKKFRERKERQNQLTAAAPTYDTAEARAILNSANLTDLPATSGRLHPTAALATLLRRDVLGSPDAIDATQAMNNKFAFAELLALRTVADEQVWPSDFRAEAILRNEADKTNDLERLRLEDSAFVGGDQLVALAGDAKKARSAYEATTQRASDYADAIEQRDELLAKLPWALRWAELAQSKTDQDNLKSLWNDAVEFLPYFETPVADRGASVDIGGWKQIVGRFDEYLKLSDKAGRLLDEGGALTPREWVRRAIPFFATPLVSDPRRRQLRNRLVTYLKQANAVENTEKEPPSETTPDLPFARWETHPLRAMFAHDDPVMRGDGVPGLGRFPSIDNLTASETKSTDSWVIAANIRDEYLRQADKTTWSTISLKQVSSRDEFTKFYRELIAYDELGRSQAVALCAGNEFKEYSPQNVISRLDHLQIATYFDWRVARSIRDFYGPTSPLNSTDGTTSYTTSYFFTQATEWVKTLDTLTGDGRPFGQLLARKWKGIFDTLSKSTGPCVSMTLDRTQLDFPATDPDPQIVKLTVNSSQFQDVQLAGMTALEYPKYSLEASGPKRERRPVPLAWTAQPSSKTESIAIAAGDGTLPFRCYFRGHVAKETAVNLVREKVKEAIKREIPIYDSQPKNSTVMVKGIAPQRLWIMVILDCSYSMNEPMSSREGVTQSEPRFAVAKRALKDMLSSLLDESRDQQTELRVGLMAYGYRSGLGKDSVVFGTDEDTYIDDRAPKLRDLDPSVDVGILVPLVEETKWGTNEFKQMSKLIDRRIAMGYTPLFMSIVHAANHMKWIPKEDQKWIVVLTDGVDNQDTLGWDSKERMKWKLNSVAPAKTGKANAEKALLDDPELNIRIVGIGIPDKKTAQAAVDNNQDREKNQMIVTGLKHLEEFCDSKKDQNGKLMRKLVFTQNGEELAKQLTIHIPPVSFRAVQKQPEGEQRVVPTEKLGNRLQLQNTEGTDYVIEVRRGEGDVTTVLASSNLLHMSGGERFEMVFMNTTKNLLFHRGWEDIKNKAGGVADNQNALKGHLGIGDKIRDVKTFVNQNGTSWQAALLRTRRDTENIRVFRVAFRPLNETVSPARPSCMRAVVTPLDQGGRPVNTTPYYFESHDIRYSKDEPLPVIELRAVGWENEWKQANLTMWLISPDDEKYRPEEIQISPSILDEAGTNQIVHLPKLNSHLKLKIEKEESNSQDGSVTLRIDQTWGTGARPATPEELPILQVYPSPKGGERSIQLDQERIKYSFVFPGQSERKKKYDLRVLDPSSFPATREPKDAEDAEKPVKKLWWEKIVVE